MLRVRDDMGRDVLLPGPPRRIVSLVPSETFTLFALGAGDRVVGRTRYCVAPAEAAAIPCVGGTKDVDVDGVLALEPDLVLANQEENARPALEALVARGARVFVAFPRRFADGVALMARLARMLELGAGARAVIARGYELLAGGGEGATAAPRAFVPIWDDPLMTFSDDCFAADLLAQAGIANAFGDRERRYPLAADLGRRSPVAADQVAERDRRYPRVTQGEVIARAPDCVLLPDEPFAFGAAHAARFRALAIPAATHDAVRCVSGQDLFWYGARSLDGLVHLRALAAELRLRAGAARS